MVDTIESDFPIFGRIRLPAGFASGQARGAKGDSRCGARAGIRGACARFMYASRAICQLASREWQKLFYPRCIGFLFIQNVYFLMGKHIAGMFDKKLLNGRVLTQSF